MDCSVTDEVKEVIRSLRKFIEIEITPLNKKYEKMLNNKRELYDEEGKFVKSIREELKEIRKKSSQAGFYNMFGPAELGGGGDTFGPVSMALIYEDIFKTNGLNLFVEEIFPPGLFTGGLTPVLLGMREEVKEKVLPEIASGESIMCFALSEPDAGSDVWGMKTSAIKEGDHWVINGTKQWITNSPYADYAIVFAITNPNLVRDRKGGISAFLVPFDDETCRNTSVIPILGDLGSRVGIISIENAKVHESYLIGDLDDGFGKALHGVDTGRIVMSAKSLGVAQWGLNKALNYAGERKTFGTVIGQNQMIQQMIADSGIDIYAARNMLLHCAWKMENQNKLPLKEISILKAFTTEMSQRVLDRCMQIHGGMGLTNEMKLEGAWRWARSMRIPDGTSEIQRRTIARRLLIGDRDFS